MPFEDDLADLNEQMPAGVKVVPFDPERDIAPEGGPDDCDGS